MTLSECRKAMNAEIERLRANGADEPFINGVLRAMEILAHVDRLRPEVERFAVVMEAKLRLNDYKGGWRVMSTDEIFERIDEELDELRTAMHPMRKDNPKRVLKEAADVANFCMFIADSVGALKDSE